MSENKNAVKFPVIKKIIEDHLEKDTEITPAALQSFQEKYWEQLVPNFSQALKLLDIHSVPRSQIIWSINERLIETLKPRIETKALENDSKKVQKLWQKLIKPVIGYIDHPFIRPVIMQVLGKMTTIKEKYTKIIVENDSLYSETPMPVLRHIWLTDADRFNEKVFPLIDNYISHWSSQLVETFKSNNSEHLPVINCSTKRRRKDANLCELIDIIGDNERLYMNILTIIREKIDNCLNKGLILSRYDEIMGDHETTREDKSTKKRKKIKIRSLVQQHPFVPNFLIQFRALENMMFLSQLRFDLIMSLNDAKVENLSKNDAVYKIAWCLDACIRNRKIDRRHSSEMASYLKKKRQLIEKQSIEVAQQELHSQSKRPRKNSTSQEEIEELAKEILENSDLEKDLQIICQDPCVLYVIFSSIIRIAMNDLAQDFLPRDSLVLHFLVNLISIGLSKSLKLPEGMLMPLIPNVNKMGSELPPEQNDQDDFVRMPLDIEKALFNYILPSACLLQINVWRSQLSDEIKSSIQKSQLINQISGVVSSPMTPRRFPDYSLPSSPPSKGAADLSLSNLSDLTILPNTLKKKIEDSVKNINLMLPSVYLLHPIGHLLIQYHALFAAERRDWVLLRIILKGIISHIQSSSFHPKTKRTSNKSTSEDNSKPKRANSLEDTSTIDVPFIFRWRPECLQSVTLGLLAAPHSSKSSSVSEPKFFDFDETSSEFASSKSSSSMHVTRNELISLLKATILPVTSDVQIAALIFLNRILINSTSDLNEKERHLNSIQKYVNSTNVDNFDEEETEKQQSNALFTFGNTFKTSNAKIMEMVESLRNEVENVKFPATKINLIQNITPQTPGQSAQEPTSPVSSSKSLVMGPPSITTPLNKQAMPPPFTIKSPAYNTIMSSRKPFDVPINFPAATPLTNPGLSAASPIPTNQGSSSNQIMSPKND